MTHKDDNAAAPDTNKSETNNRMDIENQLLKTIKYTGETNKTVITMVDSMLQFQQTMQRQGRLKLLFLFIPIIFVIAMSILNAYKENAKYDYPEGYVAQVTISGPIAQGSKTASAASVIPALRAAFADTKAKGVFIKVNTPGGSPTQSHLIYDEIKRLQEEYPDTNVNLMGIDMMTSGGMWIASAVDKISAIESTYVGSIGVIVSTFNFSKLAEKLEVDRLVLTSGKSKSQLDQFLPPKKAHIENIERNMSLIHNKFIEIVTDSRGDKLNGSEEELFSGNYWLGNDALKLGLVDKVTTPTRLLLEEYQTTHVKDYSKKPGFFDGFKLTKLISALSTLENINDFAQNVEQQSQPEILAIAPSLQQMH